MEEPNPPLDRGFGPSPEVQAAIGLTKSGDEKGNKYIDERGFELQPQGYIQSTTVWKNITPRTRHKHELTEDRLVSIKLKDFELINRAGVKRENERAWNCYRLKAMFSRPPLIKGGKQVYEVKERNEVAKRFGTQIASHTLLIQERNQKSQNNKYHRQPMSPDSSTIHTQKSELCSGRKKIILNCQSGFNENP